ncbi:MSMEG_4193 family putative phosphomutase [Frigoribacterium sp. ACAM 257]|uniref:MSMEG_4193 family putative phosphomutase n=1 Tax=Frigoribacterium sp. ACAM 257 TaxID=2508998 RepID=UPI0011B995CD|nr:MSMEG_4193 family putative phosphomutase [Frigoribacterium sp. ACAM 257]TWX40315.1 MSMEG_4193 family putative phosphomutase [Frigoribacterium sp. ACAM 257]
MATVVVVRHGRTTANASGVLAGRTAGVLLDEVGRQQAAAAGARLAVVPFARVVTSPLERCRETTEAIVAQQSADASFEVLVDDAITECDYGDWQGRPLSELAGEDLWQVVQRQPSAVTFPGGETMSGMQHRAVSAIRAHDAAVEREHGPGAVWLAVSHGDVVKSVLADALGMHLDLFQRISVGPASVSIVRYGTHRTDVLATNTDGGDLGWLRGAAPSTDAAVGGGASTV